MSDSRQHAPLYDVANLKELCQDAESCGRLSKFEEEFLDSMREKVLTLCKPASLGVQAEVRALEARLRRHGLFGRPLFFDVLADDADRRSATGCSEVGRGPEKSVVKHIALRYDALMSDKRIINARVTDEEADILASYAEEMGQSQTDVLRSFIRSLEGRLKRITPSKVDPYTLPSLPLSRSDVFPPVAAVYFFLTEGGDVLYIGSTANLSIRCGSHLRYQAALEADPHARIHWIERRSGREAFEAACIRRFNPPMNVRGKSA